MSLGFTVSAAMGADFQAAGADGQLGQESFVLSQGARDILLNVIAHHCLARVQAQAGGQAFITALPSRAQCLRAKPPTLKIVQGQASEWLHGASLHSTNTSSKKQYWVLQMAEGGVHRVHQIMCWLANGPPPLGKSMACHYKCDESLCLNPHHLSWGDQADNHYHLTYHTERRVYHLHQDEDGPERSRPQEWVPVGDLGQTSRKKRRKR